MSLLNEVMQHPLDPGYEAAAAARRDGGRTGGPRSLVVVTVLFAIVAGVIAGVAVRQLRVPQPEVDAARQSLEAEIERRQAGADTLQASNERLRAEIAELQERALSTAQNRQLALQVRTLGTMTGEIAVTGVGVVVTVDDAVTVADPETDSTVAIQGRVQDRDLQIVVNGLWEAGAEAIAVNGERLTALSAIRSAGEAVLVGFRPLSPPYTIQVIGNPQTIQTAFASNLGGQYLQALSSNFGIRSTIEQEQLITVPAAGSLTLRYARPLGAGTEDTATSGASAPTEVSTSGSARSEVSS
jgi:uncharacterized protein YlxW (UPF0749 family)